MANRDSPHGSVGVGKVAMGVHRLCWTPRVSPVRPVVLFNASTGTPLFDCGEVLVEKTNELLAPSNIAPCRRTADGKVAREQPCRCISDGLDFARPELLKLFVARRIIGFFSLLR